MNATQTQIPLTSEAAQQGAQDSLAATGTMMRFVARRNRLLLITWPVVIVGLFAYVSVYYHDLLDTQQALDDFASISNTASIKALTGLAAGPATLGGAVWTTIWMTSALMLAFAVVFLVTRTGRADEEAGRTELLRSRVLGLHACSVAAWAVIAGMCVVTGVGVAVASIVSGLDPVGSGVMGSLVLGASVTGVGLVAIGVAAVTGQIAATPRAANATASAVVGIMYVLRMIGDLGSGTLTWASPVGWGQEMQPWGANRWWPLALSLVLTVVLLGVALAIEARRDVGAGLLVARSGPAGAPARFASPLGLALHLQRNVVIGWTVTVVLAAVMFGSVAPSMTELADDSAGSFAQVLGGTGVEALLSLLVTMTSLIVTVFAIQTTVTMRQDEASGIIEAQLAGAVSRTRWAGQRLLIPAVGSAVLLLISGALIGVGYASAGGGADLTGSLMLAALTYWPAVMLLAGIAVFLFGWLPHFTIAGSWAILAAMWILVVSGDALNVPQAVLDVMPFTATPHQPLEPMAWTPVVLLALVGLGLLWAGVSRFGRRDIQTD